ncbi:MAG: hypothetical protein PHI97_02925 [Desulfobulbus sp.]|nr:hypothetical protein [Desulfobulbus sp.]
MQKAKSGHPSLPLDAASRRMSCGCGHDFFAIIRSILGGLIGIGSFCLQVTGQPYCPVCSI